MSLINNENAPYPEALHAAVAAGNMALVRQYLVQGVDIDAVAVQDGFTPLIVAARHGRVDIMRLLLEEGAAYDKKDAKGLTADSYANMYNQIDVMDFMHREVRDILMRRRQRQQGLLAMRERTAAKQQVLKSLIRPKF